MRTILPLLAGVAGCFASSLPAVEQPNHPIPAKSRAVALDVALARPSELPAGASLDGDILTVTVPPGSAEQGCIVSIPPVFGGKETPSADNPRMRALVDAIGEKR